MTLWLRPKTTRLVEHLSNFSAKHIDAVRLLQQFGARHFHDIDRLAIVGDKQWQAGLTLFCKPFTTAEIRYFETGSLNDARLWVAETGE